jgi:hypothetical protein
MVIDVFPGHRVLPAQPSPAHGPLHAVVDADFGRLDQVSAIFWRRPSPSCSVCSRIGPPITDDREKFNEIDLIAQDEKWMSPYARFTGLCDIFTNCLTASASSHDSTAIPPLPCRALAPSHAGDLGPQNASPSRHPPSRPQIGTHTTRAVARHDWPTRLYGSTGCGNHPAIY